MFLTAEYLVTLTNPALPPLVYRLGNSLLNLSTSETRKKDGPRCIKPARLDFFPFLKKEKVHKQVKEGFLFAQRTGLETGMPITQV